MNAAFSRKGAKSNLKPQRRSSKDFLQTLRQTLETEIGSRMLEYNNKEEFPWDCVKILAPLGVWGMIMPPKYGGLGLTHATYVQALEELGRIDSSLALTAESHNSLCANTILFAGTQTQKKKYLPVLSSGASLGAWALTEPGAGSDAKSIQTTAQEQEDGWALNGAKTFTTQGSVAGIYVIFAVTTPGEQAQGISAFVVEAGTPGLEVGKKEKKMGLHASDTAQLNITNLKIPKGNLLGEKNRGFQVAMKILEAGRVAISGVSLGMARSALEAAIECLRKKEKKDKPAKETPGLLASHKLIAQYSSRLHAVRHLTLHAAHLLDAGKRFALYGSMAKLLSGELAMNAATEMMDIVGWPATSAQHPIGRQFKDAKLYQIGEGTSEIQAKIIARHLLANPAGLTLPGC